MFPIILLLVSLVNRTKPNKDHGSSVEKTEVLYGVENAEHMLTKTMLHAKNMAYVCGDSLLPSFSIGVETIKNEYINFKKRGIKTKFITEFTKDNIHYCKDLMEFVELRHMDDVKGNMVVTETEYVATLVLQGPTSVIQTIYSNAKAMIEQHHYFFENLWIKATPAEQRIREIEKGLSLGSTEIIAIPSKMLELFIDIVKSSNNELLMILPTVNAFLREYRLGIIHMMIQAASKRNVQVRILTPTDDTIENILSNINTKTNQQQQKEELEDLANFGIQTINQTFKSVSVNTVTIIISDRKRSLVIEKTDDSKEDFMDAVGLATYSTSEPTVLSYVSIFENLWSHVKLYYQLESANEQLKIHDKMQKEFINIASHEMRTPAQSILAYSELLQEHPEHEEKIIQGIHRNAIRLKRLTNDILDVTKIESGTLTLNNEKFSLNDLILSIISDFKILLNKENSTIKLLFEFDKDFIIEADKGRITQVIHNLISNALKFTKQNGHIYVNLFEDQNKDQVIFSVKDDGTGIDVDFLPRLFTKFATRSYTGTGLGLFISKNIIQIHGGKIWVENNKYGKGATFSFSLPLICNYVNNT